MLKRIMLAFGLVVIAALGPVAAGLAASVHGGGVIGAAPSNIVPASADVYAELNGSGGQAAAFSALWSAYRSHPGTAAALAGLLPSLGQSSLGQSSLPQMGTALAPLADRVALALWAPTAVGPKATPRVAAVAQLKLSALTAAGGPLSSLGALSPVMTYHGVAVYRVPATAGATTATATTTYACVVSGDGVIASDIATIDAVIDTATFRAPALAANAAFIATVAALPATRAALVYLTPHYFEAALAEALAAAPNASTRASLAMTAQRLKQPLALSVSASSDGLSMAEVGQPANASAGTTPNEGAALVGNNAVLYSSLSDLVGLLVGSGALTPNVIAQFQQQTGLDVQRDLAPLLSHEVVLDVNDETSALLMAASQSGLPIPALPGSFEVAMWVDSPSAALGALHDLANALLRALKVPAGSASIVQSTLPDGTVVYSLAALPGVSYTIKGHWALISTNLSADLAPAKTSLAADAGYQAALAHVAGTAPLVSIEYVNVPRLLGVVDAWLKFIADNPSLLKAAGGPSVKFSTADWKKFEPLFTPLGNIVMAERQTGAGTVESLAFIGIRP